MNTKIVLFPFLMAFILLVGCSENATEPTGDPEVKITVDWNSLNNTTNKVKANSAFLKTVSDSITHFGARLVYVNENAVFSQSVEKTTAEEEGIITLDVPATDEAKLFSVAVRKTANEEKSYLLVAIKNLSKYNANTVNILNKKPNAANKIVQRNSVILLLRFKNCFFHSGGICFS